MKAQKMNHKSESIHCTHLKERGEGQWTWWL